MEYYSIQRYFDLRKVKKLLCVDVFKVTMSCVNQHSREQLCISTEKVFRGPIHEGS